MLYFTMLFTLVASKEIAENKFLFKKEQIIYSSNYNITKILVPPDGSKFLVEDSSDVPSIFFAVTDKKYEGGSCIYVLEGLVAYEVLEGGRDSTSEYNGTDKTIYFGSNHGVYKYLPDSLSATKLGPFKDDIIQIQKAAKSDSIYFLNSENILYKLGKNGTVKTRIKSIACATEFVLDTFDNIYYIDCRDSSLRIMTTDGIASLTSALEDFRKIKLIRPSFIMEKSIPFLADGILYILHVNGTCDNKELHFKDTPSAFSIDAALYLVGALNGNIYEFNVMDVLLKSMFGLTLESRKNISKIVMSIMGITDESVYGYWSNVLDVIKT